MTGFPWRRNATKRDFSAGQFMGELSLSFTFNVYYLIFKNLDK